MKKLLGIVVLSLLWCNVGISGENKFTVGAININLPNEYEFKKIGTNAGDAHVSAPYRNVFYAQVKEGKLVEAKVGSLPKIALDAWIQANL